MATRICVTYGELITDTSIQRANPLPPGVYIGGEPSVSNAALGAHVVSLLPDATKGVTAYRTVPQTAYHGSATIYEDGNINFNIDAPDAHPRLDVLVVAHKWTQGAIDSGTGEPTGVVTPEMAPVYGVIKGVAAAVPVAPTVTQPYDVDGRRALAVALVRTNVDGSCSVTRLNDMRLENALMRTASGRLSPNDLPWGPSQIPVFSAESELQAVVAAERWDTELAIISNVGLFQYRASLTTTPVGNVIVAPADNVGRWILVSATGSGGGGDGTGGMIFLSQTFS